MPRLVGRVPLVQAKEGLMPQLIKKRRSSWALLVVGSLIASFLAVGATPVAAAPEAITDANMAENQSYKPSTSACVGAATESASDFSDVSDDNVHREAITCLRYYGVTQGTGDGSTYEPQAPVTRTQMARFIRRVSGVAGANVTNVLGDFEEVAQDGYEATQKDPSEEGYKADNYIERHEMASLISRLLIEVTDDNSQYNVELDADTSKLKVTTSDGTEVLQDDFDYFEDSRNTVPRAVDSAISLLYELGVSNGRNIVNGKVQYEPQARVTRASMASFILRALAHSPARPAGLSAQVDTSNNEVVVSARTERFQPEADVTFDVFTIATNRVDEAFRENGSCSSNVAQLDTNATLCTVDVLDRATGENGDERLKVAIDASGSTTVWVWTADSGARITEGADQEGLIQLALTQKPLAVNATKAKVTSTYEGTRLTSINGNDEATVNVVPYYRAAFGESIDFTIQLVNAEGSEAGPSKTDTDNDFVVTRSYYRAVDNAGKVPAAGGLYVHDTSVVITGVQEPAAAVDFGNPLVTYIEDTANPGGGGTSGPFTATSFSTAQGNSAVKLISTGPETVTVDAEGKARFSVSYEDLSETAGDQVLAVYTVTGGPGDVDLVGHDGGTLLQVVLFTDAVRAPTKASITVQGDNYSLLPGRTGSRTSVNVDVTVHDQFGVPMSGQNVKLKGKLKEADDRTVAVYPNQARPTSASGTVRIGYQPSSSEAVVQQLQAVVGGKALADDTTPFFWVDAVNPNASSNAIQALDNQAASKLGRIFAGNLEKNELVVDTNNELDGGVPGTDDFYTGITPSLVTYGDDHDFKVNGVTASLRDFENALATGLAALKADPTVTHLRLGWEDLNGAITRWYLRSVKESITKIKVQRPPNADDAAAATTAAITATVNNLYDGPRALRFAYRPTTTAWAGTNFELTQKLLVPLNSGRLGRSHAFSDIRDLAFGATDADDNTSTDDGFILGSSSNLIFSVYDTSIVGSDTVEGGFTAAAAVATTVALVAETEYEFVFWLDGLTGTQSGTTVSDQGAPEGFKSAALEAVQEGVANGTLQTVRYTTPAAP